MASMTPRRVLLLWIIGISSILTLAGIGPYPFGLPALAERVTLYVLLGAILGVPLGAVLGAAQSFLLRQGRSPSPVFVASTSVGMAVAWALWSVTSVIVVPLLRSRVEVVGPPVNYISAILMATALAVSQAYALRREGMESRVWALSAGIGWFVAWTVGPPIATALIADSPSVLWFLVDGLAFGLVYSSITAIAILRRMRRGAYLAA